MATAEYTDALEVPNSSNIDYVYYNNNTRVLWIEFLSGSIIGYRNVTRDVFNGFKEAVQRKESVGKYYNAVVKGKYHGTGVDVDRVQQVANASLPGVTQPQKYVVTGYSKTTREISASSIDEAVRQFNLHFPGSTVTEVTVKFT